MHNRFLFIALVLLSFKAYSQGLLGTGLEISVSGDMVYEQGLNTKSTAEDKLTMRGAEMIFYAPIDHQFDGVLSAASHDENGKMNFELHELYIASSKLVPRSNIKFGQFFLGIGRLNRFHQHDWAFTTAPLVHQTFFDKEGVFDSGVEYNYLLSTRFNANLTVGLTSGYRYGHSHTNGNKPKAPTHYLRLSKFTALSSTKGADLGLNFLGRTDPQGNRLNISGLDFTAKFREGRVLKYLLQSEFWYKNEKDINDNIKEQVGLYIFNEVNTGEQTSAGLRIDAYKDLTKRNSLTNKRLNNITWGASLQSTYRSSEFAKIRTTLSHQYEREEGKITSEDTRFALQFIFILGSHPAHEF